MLCLGIESSCDETALALVRDGRLVDECLASQAALHSLFGGVVPELASRQHGRFIGPLYDELMGRNGLNGDDIDLIAVARGPGLLGSLLVGVAFAKGLALGLGKPLIGVNHLHAHLLAAGLEKRLEYPALGVLASGGHTAIYRITGPDEFIMLGRGLDDAAGEAFDKTGKEMGLDYPAGREIDALAQQGAARTDLLPEAYMDNDSLNFSFSGLKTSAILKLRHLRSANAWDDKIQADFCASFNRRVADAIRKKAELALDRYEDYRTIVLAGGVAANSRIREQLEELARDRNMDYVAPALSHCTDNGAMIAFAGYLLGERGWRHDLTLEAVPRGRVIPEDMLKK